MIPLIIAAAALIVAVLIVVAVLHIDDILKWFQGALKKVKDKLTGFSRFISRLFKSHKKVTILDDETFAGILKDYKEGNCTKRPYPKKTTVTEGIFDTLKGELVECQKVTAKKVDIEIIKKHRKKQVAFW